MDLRITMRSHSKISLVSIAIVSLLTQFTGPTPSFGDEASLRARRTPVVEAYERTRNSIVNISAKEKVQLHGMGMWGDIFTYPSERRSVGSGFIIHEDGYIVTNAHVVSAATQLKVILADGTEYPARLIGRDTKLDLAIIKVDAHVLLKPITMGRSDDLMIGEQTIAIGNPVGLENTLTTGVVSALHRELDIDGKLIYRDVIQTDASINPGNSGGPLLNILGELIGINTAIRTDAQNIGFAIPVDQLREILPDVLNAEKLNKVLVGLTVNEAQPASVAEVRSGSPADQAGIKPGDVIAAINGKKVQRGVDFHVAMLERKAGDEVQLSLLREGKSRETKLALVPVPKPDGKKLAKERLGLTIADVKETTSKKFRWDREPGVIVMAVDPRGPAAEANIEPGDLLVSLERHGVGDVDQFGAFLAAAPPGEVINIGLLRERRGTIYGGEVRTKTR